MKRVVRGLVGDNAYRALSRLKERARHWKRLATGADPWVRPDLRLRTQTLGGWTFSFEALSESSIVYSLGIGRDIEFDRAVIRRFGAHVYAFDPTPSAIEWIANQNLPPEFHALALGIADYDGTARFIENAEPDNPSFSFERGAGERAISCEVRRVRTIMDILGHSWIDLLKMDIEGAEYGVIADVVREGIDVKQLLVEFHHRKPWIGVEKTVEALRMLRSAGYDLFHVSWTGHEFSFRRRRLPADAR